VFRYADEIFSLGRELMQAVKGEPPHAPKRFRVGVSDALPKLTTYRLIEPALAMQPAFRLHVRIDETERLLGELAVHAVDLVIADAPMVPSTRVRVFSHLLGETSMSIYGAAALARTVRRSFPRSLHGAPLLLQTTNTAVRQPLDHWFDVHGIEPTIVGEVEDMAMLQTLGEHGLGLFAAPTVMRKEICRRYHVAWVGELDKVREKFYAISVERRITHPAVRLIADQAQTPPVHLTPRGSTAPWATPCEISTPSKPRRSHTIREVAAAFENPRAALFDRQGFDVHAPRGPQGVRRSAGALPLLHIDTTWNFREMIEFRDPLLRRARLQADRAREREASAAGMNPSTIRAASTRRR